MKLRKDDPIYYRNKLNALIGQALEEGLKIRCEVLENGVRIYFEASNGDSTATDLLDS